MSKINDGGPAFPVPGLQHDADFNGMTLRDRIAMEMMPTIWKQFQEEGTARKYDNWRDGVVIEAYQIADAAIDFKGQA